MIACGLRGKRPRVADWDDELTMYACMLHRGFSSSLAQAMDGRTVRHGIITPCHSAATSETVMHLGSSLIHVNNPVANAWSFASIWLTASNRCTCAQSV